MMKKRNEDGATTVMVAAMALVLFGAGALAIDVGQVFAKRSALQSNVDHAVLAAAAELDNPGGCNSEVVATATDYLLKAENAVPDQASVDLSGSPDDGDGYIRCNDWRVDLWAPQSHVSYGMARAVTATEGLDVPAHAAVQIKSPATSSSLPMYAVSGCDQGTQQISDPPPGHNPATAPPALVPDSSPHNEARLTGISPEEVESATSTTVPMTVTGNKLSGAAYVGFTNEAGDHYEVAPSPAPTNTEVQIDAVPQAVLDADGVWWVRVKDAAGNWSDPAEAQPFTVGDLLFCDGAISGNFGTLKIARDDTNNGNWLSWNIIKGAQPLLAEYDGPSLSCDDSAPWITSEHEPNDGTNCVGTDPGFPNSAATDGFVQGSGGEPGRLDHDTKEGCDRNGGSSRTTTSPYLNDDLLACFILDGYTVADVVSGSEPGILSSDIFQSPRFFQMPVIPVEATQGSSNFYPIVDFRAGFVTMEGSGSPMGSHNGVEFKSNHVSKVTVLLFDDAVLPETAPAVGGEIDYIGSGIKVPVLVE